MKAVPVVVVAVLVSSAAALDNGLAQTPPMGFRTWNQFGIQVNQTLMLNIYKAMSTHARTVDGVPTSLLQLGYTHAGIDDGWQLCNSGPDEMGFHNSTGYPIVDTVKFPDMAAMTAAARSFGVIPGWYANNCHCADHNSVCKGKTVLELDANFGSTAENLLGSSSVASEDQGQDQGLCYAGDAAATHDYGFASLKVDSCGVQKNVYGNL